MASARARPPLPPGPWLVVGLARSGVAAARALLALGERVVAVDSGSGPPPPDLPAGLEVHLGTDGLAFLAHARAVVKSPGVPREAAVIAAARERGVPVLGELELGWRLLPNEFIAVTGTNGKTTTVELLGHIHREAGLPVCVAGNVGTALTGLAGGLASRRRRRLRGELLSARGHARLRAGGRGAAQRRGRPPRPPRHAGGLPRRQAADLRAPGQRRHRGRAVRAGGRGPRWLRAARAVRPRRRARRPRAAICGGTASR